MFRFFFEKPTTNFLRIPLEVGGRLYVSPMPYGPYDTTNALLRVYRRHHISRVIALVTDGEVKQKAKRNLFGIYAKHGMAVFRVPFPDLTAPVQQDISRDMPGILEALKSENVVVHCNAGIGRTGIMVCCIIRAIRGCSGEEAIDYVRSHMHTDLTSEQRRFICTWEP
jgi:protein-tyrosine phosphatase